MAQHFFQSRPIIWPISHSLRSLPVLGWGYFFFLIFHHCFDNGYIIALSMVTSLFWQWLHQSQNNGGILIKTMECHQCWKFPQIRQSEADNFGGGPGTFCWFFFDFMFLIWDSRHEDLQLFDWVFFTLNVTFIFARVHRNSAAVTPGKYECDSEDITNISPSTQVPVMEFSNPHPCTYTGLIWS